MAERRSVVVRSSKRSAIKKVEVITVVGNNVASVTASHPVGVVVAERRRGPPAGGEPRPVFIPGCPLPQVLATEVAVDLEVTRGGQRPAHRPLKTGTCGLGSHAGPPKSAECRQTVTDDSENKENYPRDKIYDPRVYVDSLPKDSDEQFEQKPSGLHSGSDAENTTDSSQNSDSSVQFGQRCPSPPSAGDMEEVEEGLPRESSHTGPPRYVLLHGGAAQTHHSCSEGREALERESQETSTESSQENQKVTIHNSDMTSKDTGSSSWDSVARKKQAGKSSVSSVETDEIAIGGSECQHQTPANLKTKDQPARVIQVKRGSLSIRTKPHELRHSARGGCRSVSVVSSGARGRGRGVRVLHRGTGGAMSTVRRTHPQVTGGASRTEGSRSRPSRMDGRLGASDERKGQRGRNGSVGVIHPPDATSPRKQPPARPRRVTWAPSPAKERSTHPQEHPRGPPPPEDAPEIPQRHPSSTDAPSTTSSSSSSSSSSFSSSSSSTPQGDTRLEDPEEGAARGLLGQEELAAIGDWMAETRQELRRMREGELIGSYKPVSLSGVLKDLAAGNLDEDKFLISRRVQHYFREAVRRAREKQRREEEEALAASSSRTRPPHPDLTPAAPPSRPHQPTQPSRPPPPPPPLSHSTHPKQPLRPQAPRQPPLRPQAPRQPPSRPQAPRQPPSHPQASRQPPSRPQAPRQPPSRPQASKEPPSRPQIPRHPSPPRSHPSAHPQTHPTPRPPHPLTQPSSRPPHRHPSSQPIPQTQPQPSTQPEEAPQCHPSFPSFPAYRPPPLFFQYPGVAKQRSHREHRTNRKRDEKRAEESDGRGGMESPDAQMGTAEVVPPRRRQEKTTIDPPKPSLQVSTQASVDIPRGNTFENLPGISIEPVADQRTGTQRRNVVIQMRHRSSDESSPESNGEGVAGPGDDGDNSDDDGGDGGDGEGLAASVRGEQDEIRDEDGEERIPTQPPPPLSPPPPPNEPSPADGDGEGGSHTPRSTLQDPEQRNSTPVEGKRKETEERHNKNESRHSPAGGTEGGGDEERLPGYFPEVVWREVTVEDKLEEDIGGEGQAGQFLREAEERLRQHDLRQRILDKLVDRLQVMIRGGVGDGGGAGDVAAVSGERAAAEEWHREDEQKQEEEEEEEQDVNSQWLVEATREVLAEVVRERLAAARREAEALNAQTEQPSPPTMPSGGEESASSPPPSPSHSPSPSSSPSPPAEFPSMQPSTPMQPSPTHAPPIHPPPVPTPPPRSPPPRTPSLSPPRRQDTPPKPPLTPQLSVEDEERREPVPTPPASPPASPPPAPEAPRTPPRTPTPPKYKPQIPSPQGTPEKSLSYVKGPVQPVSPPSPPPAASPSVGVGLVVPVKTPSPSDVPPIPDGAAAGDYVTLVSQGTQADYIARVPVCVGEGIAVGDEGVGGEGVRSVTSPETPSVVCHSSLDVTASSLAEVPDISCQCISEGEVLVSSVGEPGECPPAQRLPSLMRGVSCVSSSVCQSCELEHVSEGEIESEGVMEEGEEEEEGEVMEESREQDVQTSEEGTVHRHTQSSAVSVVVDESFSIGEAAVRCDAVGEGRDPAFLDLQRRNEELMKRLGQFGSFSFLLKSTSLQQESSSSASSSPFSHS